LIFMQNPPYASLPTYTFNPTAGPIPLAVSLPSYELPAPQQPQRVEQFVVEPPLHHAAPPCAPPPEEGFSYESGLHFLLAACFNFLGVITSHFLTRKKQEDRLLGPPLLGLSVNFLVASVFLFLSAAQSYSAAPKIILGILFCIASMLLGLFAYQNSDTAGTLRGRASDFFLYTLVGLFLPAIGLVLGFFQKRRRSNLGSASGFILFHGLATCMACVSLAHLSYVPAISWLALIVGFVEAAAHIALFVICIVKAVKDNFAFADTFTYFLLVVVFGPLGLPIGIFSKRTAARHGMLFGLFSIMALVAFVFLIAVPRGLPFGIALLIATILLTVALILVSYDRHHGHNQ